MKIDFHLHTNYSDGRLNLNEVDNLIKENRIDYFSITDHDIYDPNCNAFFLLENCTFIKGMEISAKDYDRNRKVHLLAYNFDENSRILKDYVAYYRDMRNRNSKIAINNLKDLGYKFSTDSLEKRIDKGIAIYKQHILLELVKAGYSNKVFGDLYYKLNEQGVFIENKYISFEEGLKLIKDIGGVSILAHPGIYNSWELIPKLVDLGLDGIEVFHSRHTKEDEILAMKIAKEYDLLISGGSDYHGWNEEEYKGVEVSSNLIEGFLKVLKND